MIEKHAAIITRGRRLLVVRKRGTATFISPGGKPEGEEDHLACLRRELREELGVGLASAQFFGRFARPSAFEPDRVAILAWAVEVRGEPHPASEIEEIRWISGADVAAGLPLGTVFGLDVVPALVSRGAIDG